jgi:hypothetical protein
LRAEKNFLSIDSNSLRLRDMLAPPATPEIY